MTAEQSAAVDACADDAARKLTAWHAARQAIDDARHAYEAAIRAEVGAAADYREAVAAYEAIRRWR